MTPKLRIFCFRGRAGDVIPKAYHFRTFDLYKAIFRQMACSKKLLILRARNVFPSPFAFEISQSWFIITMHNMVVHFYRKVLKIA